MDSSDDLFGDSDKEPPLSDNQLNNDNQAKNDDQLNNEDEFEDEHIQVRLPSLENPTPNNPNLFLLKLPNFLNIESKPFDPFTFQEQSEAKNTVRWRYDPKQQGAKDSNARLVRWSDGSFSLLVGDELFDVSSNSLADQHLYLISNHPREQVFRAQARLENLMTFRPQSTNSSTHKKLTQSIAAKMGKSTRTKLMANFEDPEKRQMDAAKAEQERLKAKRKLESKQRQQEIKYSMNEVEDDWRYQQEENTYEDDFVVEDDDEYEAERESQLKAAKAPIAEKKRLRIEESDSDE